MLWGVNSQWLPERQWGSAGFRVGSSQPANPAFWACVSGLPLVTTKYSSQNTGKPFFLWGWWSKHCAGARPVLFCGSRPRFMSLYLCLLNYDMAIADVPFLVGDAALSFGKCQSLGFQTLHRDKEFAGSLCPSAQGHAGGLSSCPASDWAGE